MRSSLEEGDVIQLPCVVAWVKGMASMLSSIVACGKGMASMLSSIVACVKGTAPGSNAQLPE
jgi:hypothetical protein